MPTKKKSEPKTDDDKKPAPKAEEPTPEQTPIDTNPVAANEPYPTGGSKE